jgi:hypothetical protein
VLAALGGVDPDPRRAGVAVEQPYGRSIDDRFGSLI